MMPPMARLECKARAGWKIRISSLFEISTAGRGTLSFVSEGGLIGDIQEAVLNAVRGWVDDQVRPVVRQVVERSVNAGAAAMAASLLGAPDSGRLPEGVVLSAPRVAVGAMQGVPAVRVTASIGCFGPLNARFPNGMSTSRSCALRSLALLPMAQLDLPAFRQLRDRLAARNGGGPLVALYYAHSSELARVLLTRPRLAGEAVALLRDVQGAPVGEAPSSELMARARSLCEGIAPLSSAPLRAALQHAQEAGARLLLSRDLSST